MLNKREMPDGLVQTRIKTLMAEITFEVVMEAQQNQARRYTIAKAYKKHSKLFSDTVS